MNIDSGRDAFIASFAFAALPHDLVFKFSIITLILGGLYFTNGKIPKDV